MFLAQFHWPYGAWGSLRIDFTTQVAQAANITNRPCCITFEIQRIVWEFELAPPPPAPKPWGRKHNSIIPPHNSPLYWIYDMYMSIYTTSTSAMAREWWFEDITRTDVFGTVPLTVCCLRILENRFYNTSSPSGKYHHPALLHNRSKYKGLYGEKTNVYTNL